MVTLSPTNTHFPSYQLKSLASLITPPSFLLIEDSWFISLKATSPLLVVSTFPSPPPPLASDALQSQPREASHQPLQGQAWL